MPAADHRYRKISTEIWNDAKFRSLTDDGQTIFTFLLTHPSMTSIGAMRCTMRGLASEKISRDNPEGWSDERWRAAVDPILDLGMIEFDASAGCLVVPKFIKHNLPVNPNMVKSWGPMAREVPECDLLTIQLQRARYALVEKGKDSCLSTFDTLFPAIRALGEPPPPRGGSHPAAPVVPLEAPLEPEVPPIEPDGDRAVVPQEGVPGDELPGNPKMRLVFLFARNPVWRAGIPEGDRKTLADFVLEKGRELGFPGERVRDLVTRLHVWAEGNPQKARKKDWKRFFVNALKSEPSPGTSGAAVFREGSDQLEGLVYGE
jgi:hypothetical protein